MSFNQHQGTTNKALSVKNPDSKLREVAMKLIGVGYDLKAIIKAYDREGRNNKSQRLMFIARDIEGFRDKIINLTRK